MYIVNRDQGGRVQPERVFGFTEEKIELRERIYSGQASEENGNEALSMSAQERFTSLAERIEALPNTLTVSGAMGEKTVTASGGFVYENERKLSRMVKLHLQVDYHHLKNTENLGLHSISAQWSSPLLPDVVVDEHLTSDQLHDSNQEAIDTTLGLLEKSVAAAEARQRDADMDARVEQLLRESAEEDK